MILVLDIGNTNTHCGVANTKRIIRQWNMPTQEWFDGRAATILKRRLGKTRVTGATLCSVVPKAVPIARRTLRSMLKVTPFVLSAKTVTGLGLHYPKPQSIGPDRLANSIAAKQQFGAPVVVVDFGTAVTFDVVNEDGDYVGGIIAPGLATMTDYLHEKTALLPRIRIRRTNAIIGKSTEQAMRIGAFHGYRGLIYELIQRLKKELGVRRLPVVATGGYAGIMARDTSEITAVEPNLTLEGLRIVSEANQLES